MQGKNKFGIEDSVTVLYSEQAEHAVLGAILLEAKFAMEKISDRFHPEVFYDNRHQLIANAIIELYRARQTIDILTVTNLLKKKKDLDAIGGPYYITQITNKVSSSRNIEQHYMIMMEYHMRRQLIAKNTRAIGHAQDLSIDIFDIINSHQTEISDIAKNIVPDETENAYDLVDAALSEIVATRNGSEMAGITTGYDLLDAVTMGFKKGNLIILAARPGMGKTALLLCVARKIVLKTRKKVGIISLEMTKTELIKRLFSIDTKIKGQDITYAKYISDENINTIAVSSQKYAPNMLINDKSGINIIYIKSIIRRMVTQGAEMIFIDYLQLIKGSKEYRGNRESEISEVSRELKSLAKEFNVPIMALSQLSRESEKRKDKTPMLSDLRESGAIEQDADVVMFIHRPEYYGETVDEYGKDLTGLAMIIFAKQRNGPLDTVLLKFDGETTSFEEDKSIVPF